MTSTQTDLSLAQQTVLLLLNPDGRWAMDSYRSRMVLAGAVLSELALAEAITIDDGKVIPAGVVPDRALSSYASLAYQRILAKPSRKSPTRWVYSLMHKDLADDVIGTLVDRGILSRGHGTVLSTFPVDAYPEIDALPKNELREVLAAVLRGEREATADQAALIALLHACRLLDKQFPHATEERVQAVVQGEWAGAAVRSAIRRAIAAIVIVLILLFGHVGPF
ncbi:GOLPH3/VPS74 family protein [Leifsonia poae]|uniref:GOLPH3/VPS74 family protein n=1 Tax=Leifsonia poae TaxID=110933 RepID=UPI003D6925BA